MAKRKIIWSHKAGVKLYQILEYYIERNKRKTYSVKLYSQFQKNVKLLVEQPFIGIKTELNGIGSLIIGEFAIFYEVTNDHIIIHSVWDCRQNPEDLIIK